MFHALLELWTFTHQHQLDTSLIVGDQDMKKYFKKMSSHSSRRLPPPALRDDALEATKFALVCKNPVAHSRLRAHKGLVWA
mmetsp:Transcript_8852/g.26172  ORF Transcript_8852/g.26172 Transcript_8852/m.26172 type:complete len:81 (+) Transcript_8852:435-677(+)